MRRALVVAAAVLLTACSSSPPPQGVVVAPTPSTTPLSGSIGAAQYRIEVPPSWNGTLFLYSHGYVAPGHINLATDSPAPMISSWLLGHGYAIAGSSYSSTGWALEDAFKDQVALLDLFNQRFSKPVLAGGVATWNAGLDGAYAFKTLLAPSSNLQLVNITDPAANAQLASSIFDQASATPAGQARIALIAALGDLPGWFDPAGPEPAANDYAAQEAAQARWESQVDFAFEFQYRAELEHRAGGNPSWNTGVDYAHQLAISADSTEVAALYQAAGLDLAADLRALNSGPRIVADPKAAAYLNSNISFNGQISVPVLTMHTTGDGLVVPQNETAYADVVASKKDLLRQVFVHRAGHCAFSGAETIAVIQQMIKRLDTGQWDDSALQPAALNSAAQALGDSYQTVGGFFITPPAFAPFTPGPYPRPAPFVAILPA